MNRCAHIAGIAFLTLGILLRLSSGAGALDHALETTLPANPARSVASASPAPLAQSAAPIRGLESSQAVEYPWRFLHITDPHLYVQKGLEDRPLESPTLRNWLSILEQIKAFQPPPRFVLCTGDLVNVSAGDVGVANFQALLATLWGDKEAQEYSVDENLTIPIYFCPGNHEAKNSQMLNDTFDNYHCQIKSESYYMVAGDDYVILSLNSGKDEFNDAHFLLPEGDGLYEPDVAAFLEDAAAVGESTCAVVMVHHPWVNPEADFIGGSWNFWVDGSFMHYRDEFIGACRDHGLNLVLSGHYDLGVPFFNDGIWDQDGGAWEPGDGTVFVMTNGIQRLNAFRWIDVPGPGEVAVGPVEYFKAPESGQVPLEFELQQNYPNPFNAMTTIEIGMPYSSPVRLEIFNLLGQRVRVLVDGPMARGRHPVGWSGRDDGGDVVASGIYFCRLTAGDAAVTRKMVMIR